MAPTAPTRSGYKFWPLRLRPAVVTSLGLYGSHPQLLQVLAPTAPTRSGYKCWPPRHPPAVVANPISSLKSVRQSVVRFQELNFATVLAPTAPTRSGCKHYQFSQFSQLSQTDSCSIPGNQFRHAKPISSRSQSIVRFQTAARQQSGSSQAAARQEPDSSQAAARQQPGSSQAQTAARQQPGSSQAADRQEAGSSQAAARQQPYSSQTAAKQQPEFQGNDSLIWEWVEWSISD